MSIKRFCILLILLSVIGWLLSMNGWAAGAIGTTGSCSSELAGDNTALPPDDAGTLNRLAAANTDDASTLNSASDGNAGDENADSESALDRARSEVDDWGTDFDELDDSETFDPDAIDPAASGLDPADPAAPVETTPRDFSLDTTIVGHTLSQGAGSVSTMAQRSRVTFGLEEIVASIERVLPQTWGVSSIKRRQAPRKWQGPADAVLIRVEDRSMVVHHTNGFDYHPFYKIWLCPANWQGSMEDVVLSGDDGPSVLLGINPRMKVFYLTLGANTWPTGPEVLRKALELTALPITGSLRQSVDSAIKATLFPIPAQTETLSPGLLSRVVGVEKDGPLVYLEYATGTEKTIGEPTSPSRCDEPRVESLIERENRLLADRVFSAFPDVGTVYIRRLCDQLLSDKLIDRSPAPAPVRTMMSSSSQ